MKKLNIFLVCILGILSFACETELNLNPRNALTPTLALGDSSGFQSFLFGAYRKVHGFGYYGQRMLVAPDALADNLVIVNRTGRYEQEVLNSIGFHVDIWAPGLQFANSPYMIINDCNYILADIDNVTASANFKNRIKGEALFLRSLALHDLLRVYSYEPGKAVNGWNKGVILRTTPTKGVGDADLRARSTVDECYAQLEADLNQAITLLSPLPNVSFPYRVNVSAARALLARVLLYAGKYAQAATAADAALANTPAVLTTAANYATSFNTSPNPESLFEVEIRTVDWSTVDGVNNSLHSMTNNLISGSQFVVGASPDLMNAHEAGDVRQTLWTDLGGGRIRSSKWNGEKGNYLENLQLIRYSEVLLTAAEAKARSGNEDGARANINTLRTNRGLAAIDNTVTGAALINLIMNERRVELVLEGHRFFDFKRLGLDITKPAPALPLPYTDFRVIARLPAGEITLNSQLEQNPNY